MAHDSLKSSSSGRMAGDSTLEPSHPRRVAGFDPETVYASSEDGWKLAIHYWRGVGARHSTPLVMLHGLGSNRLNLHLTERYSVALAMAERGFDVYLPELRGAGLSRFAEGEAAQSREWGFADYALRDVPAVIEKVCELSNASGVHALGHSMGGMLLYAYATTCPARLRSVCTVGSPLIGCLPLRFFEKNILELAAKVVSEKGPRTIPIKTLAGAAGYLGPLGNKFIDGVLVNGDNIDPEMSLKLIHDATDNIPSRLVTEIHAHMTGKAGEANPYLYEERLERIDVPVFAIAGADDKVAVPESVHQGVSRIRSRDVRFREFGRRSGDKVDYGHLDLLIGLHAPREVYPVIADFFEEMELSS